MNTQNKKSFITYIAIITVILVIGNIVSRNWFFRLDLTDNKEHSLSNSSKSIIRKIDDYLIIKAKIDTLNILYTDLQRLYSDNDIRKIIIKYYEILERNIQKIISILNLFV